MLLGISNYCSALQVAEYIELKLNNVGHFVLDKDDKMLLKICGCSQSNGRLHASMSLSLLRFSYASIVFRSVHTVLEPLLQVCSLIVGESAGKNGLIVFGLHGLTRGSRTVVDCR